jgi:FG-GAP repeat protein
MTGSRYAILCVLLASAGGAPLAWSAVPARDSSENDAAPIGWLSQVQADLRAGEYDLTWQSAPVVSDIEPSWQAPNRRQGFRTYFTPAGIRVVPRTTDEINWRWGLSLRGYGRGGTSWAVPKATPTPAGHRIDYDRGAIGERYENTDRGLEQTFVLTAPPDASMVSGASGASGAAGEPKQWSAPLTRKARPDSQGPNLVHLDLALWGDLTPRISDDGQAIDFVTAAGAPGLHYAQLKATDATGRTLPAWMTGFTGGGASGIRLVVDAREAVYPITIDPLATGASWTAEGNQPGAQLGFSVATAGDVNGDGFSDVIVGARLYDTGLTDEGRAFVYLGSPAGLSLAPAWIAEDGVASSDFGNSVATAGDVNGDGFADVIVGAYLYTNGQAAEGAAFVYLGSKGGLSTTPAWTVESDSAGTHFGASVGTAGDVNGDGFADVIVGAPFYGGPLTGPGRAFIYLGSLSGLSTTPVWSPTGPAGADEFGFSVATAGDVNGDGFADVIVGAYNYSNGQSGEGGAFVYHGSPAGPMPTPSWTAESDQPGARFGYSVATAGDVNGDGYADVIVGAPLGDNGQTDEGRAYAYFGSPAGLTPTAIWTAESNQASAQFGTSVATAGDVNGDGYADVVVGAPFFDIGFPDQGLAYVYLGSGTGALLSPTPAWSVAGDQPNAEYGISVATAGDVNGDGYADVVVGAYLEDDQATDEGKAYVYLGSASGPAANAGWEAEGDQASAAFGASVATAGDVNGDGYADVIVGAYLYDNGLIDQGRASVYLGSASGLSSSPAWTVYGDVASETLGFSVGTAGDVNGDGFSDVIIGAPLGQDGRALVYRGSPSGLSSTPLWTVVGDQAGALLGWSVGTAGDVNGDGFSDVIIGAPGGGLGGFGEALVYLGTIGGPAADPAWTATANEPWGDFGWAVGTAGDVNGDGFSDVIVGWSPISATNGQAQVYLGSATGLSPTPAWAVSSAQLQEGFAWSVGTAGDVNGDGYADAIVGAPSYTNGEAQEGRAYVFLGSPSGLSSSPAWTAESDQASAELGLSVATAGDVNGDGYADVIVGAAGYSNGETSEGRAYVFLGSASGLSSTPVWTAEGNQTSADFGTSVATAGDVNGDGYADVIVGAMNYSNGQTNEGAAFLYYGNGGAGLSVTPQQRRADDSVPIVAGGRSFSPGSFRVSTLGRTPFGRSRVRLEWEVKPLGTSFDGTGTQLSAAPLDTLTAGAHLDELTSGLTGPDYHWRVRLHYDSALTPFAQSSRWFTAPWNGWEETDLSMLVCAAPALAVFIPGIRTAPGPTDVTIDFTDPNPAAQVTGYNVYRTTDPSLPPSSWTLLATNITDQDPLTPDLQWVDTSGANPPLGSAFYYQVTAYNSFCSLEGPH